MDADKAERRARRQARLAAAAVQQRAGDGVSGTAQGGVFVGPVARVVVAPILGQRIYFSVANAGDVIQKHHIEGAFYEPEELAIIARHFPIGGRFLDIGTNIGNHTLYVAKFLHASRVVCFEPNPEAIALLQSNVALNGIGDVVDLRHLGIGLSDHVAENLGIKAPSRNLGAGRMVEGEGSLRLERADALLAGESFDLIKIDVEGMELQVLGGLSGLLVKARPKMFVEVDNANADGFADWVAANGYRVIESFRRYRANINHLIGPAE